MSEMRKLKCTDLLDGNEFPIATPESQGICSEDILRFLKKMEEEHYEIHALEIVRNGYQILKYRNKPIEFDKMHRIYSSAKGLLATAILFAVQEGVLSLDDKPVDIFPEAIPEGMDENMCKLTVYDLLNMASGHGHNIFHELRDKDDWIKGFFEIPLTYEPGKYYIYNNGSPNMIAQIIKRKTGLDIPEYLKPRLLDPLGMELEMDYNWLGKLEPTTARMTADGMLKYAVFYAQNGKWNGKQLLKSELVEMVGKRHAPKKPDDRDMDYITGFGLYGYTLRNGGFVFHGGMTNHAIVLKRENLAVAILSNDSRIKNIDCALMDCILDRAYERALNPNHQAYQKLLDFCEKSSIAYPGFTHGDPALEKEINGKEFVFQSNGYNLEGITFCFDDGIKVVTRKDGAPQTTVCGLEGDWTANDAFLIAEPDYSERPGVRGYVPNEIPGFEKLPVVASASWVSANELIIFTRSDFYMSTSRFHCIFDEKKLTLIAHTYFLPEETPAKYYSEDRNLLKAAIKE